MLKVFYCYAHEDWKLREQLQGHLEAFERLGQIVSWDDRQILPGADWEREIESNLGDADIVLLLVSPYFMSSDYCYGREVRQALERHKEGSACVIPVIIRPVEWKETSLGALQALPHEGKPITSWRNRDEAFQDVARGVQRATKAFQSRNYERFLKSIQFPCCPECGHSTVAAASEGNRRTLWCMHCGSDLFVEDA